MLKKIGYYTGKTISVYKQWGFKGLFYYGVVGVRKRLKKSTSHSVCEKNLSNFEWEFVVNNTPIQPLNSKSTKKIITWIIPDIGYGSGGHTTIFRIINYLSKQGYKNNVHIFNKSRFTNIKDLMKVVKSYNIPINGNKFYLNDESLQSSDLYIATEWRTAYTVNRIETSKLKAYLVQDYEPYFFPLSSRYYFADNTYSFGFYHICASKWLADKLASEHNAKTTYFNLGYDPKIYFKDLTTRSNKKIVAYIRPYTERRGFELLTASLQLVYEKMKDIEVIFYGTTESLPPQTFPYSNLGILSPRDLSRLYRTATLGISLSLTNMSLVPLEMLACGLPVIEVTHPSLLNTFSNKEVLFTPPNPNALSTNILKLLKSKKLRDSFSKNGNSKVTANYSWDQSFKKISRVFTEINQKRDTTS